jgi:hypothetical protein
MLGIVAAMLLGAFLRGWHGKIQPLDRKDLERHRRASEKACKDWLYPFE